MNRLIIIRGNSGSGKSTIATELQNKLGHGTMRIPQDIIRREIIKTKDTPKNPSIQLIKNVALYGHAIRYNVIIEGILVSKRYGPMLREVAAHFRDVHVYYLDVSIEETLRRHATKPIANEVGEDQLRAWYLEKDLLAMPNERVFTDRHTKDEIVTTILDDVYSRNPKHSGESGIQ